SKCRKPRRWGRRGNDPRGRGNAAHQGTVAGYDLATPRRASIMATQAELVTVLQTEFERLKQYLATLPTDAWTKPSACALWEVRDVVAHLIFEANSYTDWITRGLRGETSTLARRPEPGSFHTVSQEARQQIATAAAQRMIAFRERLGQELLDVFGHTGDHFNDLVARLSPHEWESPCSDARGMLPVRFLVRAMIFERAMH